jgi:hypothetical protein
VPDPILDEINLTTLKEIEPRVITDNFFLDTPFQAYLRAKALVPFGGGAFTQAVFLYAPMIGGAYARGASFNITKRQTLAGTLFDPKFYEVSVPEFKEDIQVLNKGPLAVFSLIETDLRNAVNTISAITAIDMSLHGQAAGSGIVGNRPNNINGWIEALNDGVTPGWEGSIFTSYGTQPRNGVITNKLNSVPVWGGTSTGATAPITYGLLEELYQTASIGRKEPDLEVMNKALYAYIKERIQPQQRFAQERDPYFGVSGMRHNSAMILKDDYFPSLKYGQNDPDLGNWLTSTFTSPGTVGSGSNMPTSTTINVGEVLAMFNTADWLFRISDDPEYGGGFSGFVPAQDNTKVVGQTKLNCNLECVSPRTNLQAFGFGG